MASLCAFLILPNNFAAAEEVAEAAKVKEAEAVAESENPTEVLPSDYEEGNLDYLTLVDSFVTAERIPTSRFDTPANVVVITAEEIEANHYHDTSEILNNVTGVINGGFIYGSQRVLTLVDGMRREFYPPIRMIDRIEIVKGGGSALYGTDAIGGVINIITKKGNTNQTTFDVAFGQWKTRLYEFTNEGIEGKFNWFADVNFSSQEPYKIAGNDEPDIFDKISGHDIGRFAVNFGYDFTDRNSLGMSISYNKDSFGNYLPGYRGTNKGHEVYLVYDFKKGTSTPGFFKYYNVRQESAYENNLIGNEDRIIYGGDQRQRIQNIQYQNGWEFGKHKLIAGLEYYRIDRNSWYWDYNEKKLTNMAYYLQDTITPDDKWTLIPGVRLDHNNAFGNKWSPKFAANYRADENTKIFATWGNVYRAPGMEELYASAVRSGYNEYDTGSDYHRRIMYTYTGNPYLNPESGHTESIGVEHNFNDNTNIRASVFNTKIKNFIPQISDNVTSDYLGYYWLNDERVYSSITYDNAPSEKHRGFEIDFQQKINDHFQYNLGYAFVNTKLVNNHDGLWGYSNPKNVIYMGLHYADGPFKANLYGRSGSGVADKNWSSFKKTYFIIDANVSYDIADWATIYLRCNNITDKDYSIGAAHSSGRGFLAGALFKF